MRRRLALAAIALAAAAGCQSSGPAAPTATPTASVIRPAAAASIPIDTPADHLLVTGWAS